MVLDGSVALSWFFRDEAHPYADAVATRLGRSSAWVPAVWPLKIVNALVTGERRRRSTEAQATQWLEMLSRLPIHVDDRADFSHWREVLRLARNYHLSAYDASYLELALRRGLPLATLDAGLKSAASAAGVQLVS
jgi:predicted nucleic acid-binding protein